MQLRLLLSNPRWESICRGSSNRAVLSCVVCVSVTLGVTLAAWFLLWVVTHASKAEPSGLLVSLGRNSGQRPSSPWYGVARLLYEWQSPYEYGDALKTAEGLEEILQILQIVHKSQDCGQQHQGFKATVVRG